MAHFTTVGMHLW